jgi:hypothetical protein
VFATILAILLFAMVALLESLSIKELTSITFVTFIFFLTGYGLKNDFYWCHRVAVPVSIIMFFVFPVGSLLSGYYFWLLLNNKKQRPAQYCKKVKVTFRETEKVSLESTVKTGDQILTDQYVSKKLIVLAHHIFSFESESVKYGFKVIDMDQKLKFSEGAIYTAYLSQTNPHRCWFRNSTQNVYNFNSKVSS